MDEKKSRKSPTIHKRWRANNPFTFINGKCETLLPKLKEESIDLIISSPPYCIGKSYENERNASDFRQNHKKILPEMVRVLKTGGSLCWQVGYHVDQGSLTPLDYVVHNIISEFDIMILRNRIIWTFGHGLHTNKRFCGRHEVILWYTKGENYTFNLDDVRVAQKYPGKKAYKGEKRGEFSGNPLGKNPSDVWDIPNVNAGHIEKTGHPCQFPVALASRLIMALSNEAELVFDPYCGVGTTGVAAITTKRRFLGIEANKEYHTIGNSRLKSASTNDLPIRPDTPPYQPPLNTPLTTLPESWRNIRV